MILHTTKNTVLRVATVYQGNVVGALVRVGELFRDAVRSNAAGVILVHNHPSGDPTPSPDDLHLTAEALAAGRLLDIAACSTTSSSATMPMSRCATVVSPSTGPVRRSAVATT